VIGWSVGKTFVVITLFALILIALGALLGQIFRSALFGL
jgi:hypothetical protein